MLSNEFRNTSEKDEIIKVEIYSENDKKNDELAKRNESKEKNKDLAKRFFFINKSKININSHKIQFIALIVFWVLAIIDCFIRKNILPIIAMPILSYFTLLLLQRVYIIKNTRYLDITIWNIYESLHMLAKDMSLELYSVNCTQLLNIATYGYLVSLFINSTPYFSFLEIICLIMLVISYFYCFLNENIEIIKDSLNTINKIGIVIILFTSILGLILKGFIYANTLSYISWIVLYVILKSIEDYEFNKIKK